MLRFGEKVAAIEGTSGSVSSSELSGMVMIVTLRFFFFIAGVGIRAA